MFNGRSESQKNMCKVNIVSSNHFIITRSRAVLSDWLTDKRNLQEEQSKSGL